MSAKYNYRLNRPNSVSLNTYSNANHHHTNANHSTNYNNGANYYTKSSGGYYTKRRSSPVCTYSSGETAYSSTSGGVVGSISSSSSYHQPKNKFSNANLSSYGGKASSSSHVSTDENKQVNLSFSSKSYAASTSAANRNSTTSASYSNGISTSHYKHASRNGTATPFKQEYGKPYMKFDKPQYSRLFFLCSKNTSDSEVKHEFQRYGQIEDVLIVKDINNFMTKMGTLF